MLVSLMNLSPSGLESEVGRTIITNLLDVFEGVSWLPQENKTTLYKPTADNYHVIMQMVPIILKFSLSQLVEGRASVPFNSLSLRGVLCYFTSEAVAL